MRGGNLLGQVGERWERDRDRQEHMRQLARLLDVRLVLPAVSVWVLTLVWILEGAGAALIWLGLLGGLTGAWILADRGLGSNRRSGLSGVLLLTLLLVTCQGLLITARGYHERWNFMEAATGHGVRFTGQVLDSVPSTYGGFSTRVRSEGLARGGIYLDQPVTVQVYTNSAVEVGTRVRGVGELEVRGTYYRVKGGLYPQGLSERSGGAADIKGQVRERAVAMIGADTAGLVLGMAYGDDSSLGPEALSSMRVSGLTHLTAVSGANITLIFVVGYRLAQKLRLGRYLLIGAGLVCSGLYVALVGFDGSVLRAWVMGLLGGLGLVLGHGTHRVAALCSCLLLLLALAPELATDFGFSLSAIATASLLFLAPALRRLGTRFMPGICAELLSIPLSAALWCAPVLLLLSGALYPYTVLANLLVAPLVAPITLTGLLALALLGTPLLAFIPAGPLLALGGALARAVQAVAGWTASLPGSTLPVEASPLTLTLLSALVLGFSALIMALDRRLNRPAPVRAPSTVYRRLP